MKVIDSLTKIPRHVHLYVDYDVYIEPNSCLGIFRNLKEILDLFSPLFNNKPLLFSIMLIVMGWIPDSMGDWPILSIIQRQNAKQ